MKWLRTTLLAAGTIVLITNLNTFGQTFASTPNASASELAQIQELTKKIDEQNAKIDMLSQQILKLQQQLGEHRPGVMIGEGSGAPTTSTSSASSSVTTPASSATDASAKSANGNSHVVARGETLIAIARMYNVSVSDLQKFNHIDNPTKLQAGQTLLIPPSPIPSPSSSGQ